MDLNKKFEQIGVSIAERIKNTAAYLDKLRDSVRIEVLERRADTERLTDKTNKLESELAQERTIRSTADNSHDKQLNDIRTSFDKEVKDRLAKDNDHDDRLLKLRNDLTDETNSRKNADTTINKRINDTNTKLDKETVDRKAKNVAHEKSISDLDTRLKKEVQDRTTDVKNLNNRAATIEGNLAKEVKERKEAIQAEVNRAESAYPKKNGAGANGRWNIDISGRAAIATEADHAKRASEADHATKATNDNNGRNIVTTYAIQGTKIVGPNTNWNTLTDICQYKIQNCTMTAACNAPVGEYQFGILVVDGIRDALDGEHRINQTYYPHNPSISPIWVRMRNGTGWTPWKSMSTKQYVTDYAPSKAGSGANGTWNISINGNAKTATDSVRGSYPTGFNGKTSSATWGKGNQIGAFITGWSGPGNSDIAFRNNNGQLNMVIDGQYYANEGNSLVLHEGNWNNYAPSRTGGGASGTWKINVTGSSNSTTYVTPSDRIDYGVNRLQYFNLSSTSRGTAKTNGSPINDWVHVIRMNHGNKNGFYVDLAAGLNNNGLWYRRITNGAMSGWHTVLDSLNWNNYAPSKTGGGASGTWGISITGNAHTVDGYHENSFLRYRDSTATNGAGSLWNQIGIRQYNNAHPDGVGNTYSYGATLSLPGADSRLDIWYNHRSSDNGDGLWYRTGWSNDKRPWAKILDSTNYNQYAPTKTGGGASGTWNINVTGKANTAGRADWANVSWGRYTGNGGIQPPSFFGRERAGFLMSNQNVNGHTAYKNWLYMDNYGGNDVGGASAIGVARDSARAFIMTNANADRKAWTHSAELLSTVNYNNYAPTKTGGGASGTWNIGISGTAANSTKWNGLINDTGVENNSDTWIPVLNSGKLQHTTKANMKVGGASVADDSRKLSFSNRGNCSIRPGNEDKANGPGGNLNNLVLDSWWGVSFTTSCTGQPYTNKTAVSIDCRNGDLRAPNIYGRFHGTADAANSVAWGNVTGRPSVMEPHFNNGKWYNVGDDVKIGDFNHAGLLGICGLNAATGVGLAKRGAETDVATMTYDGGNIVFNKTLQANITGSAGSVDWSRVGNKPAQATRWPSWGEVTGKPGTFTPSSHTHGLLHDNLATAMANTTADNGWSMINGSYSGFLLKSIRTQQNAPAWILNNYAAGIAFGGADTKGVMSVSYDGPRVKFAGGNGTKPVWWYQLNGTSGRTYDLNNMPSSWNNVAGKPGTFTPSAHKHGWGDITGAPATATRWPSWNEVAGKPGTFTPSAHNHDSAYPSTTGARASGTWNINVNGNSGSANVAKLVGKDGGTGGGMKFHWTGQGGQPTWLWGGNNGTDMYVYNPSNFSVNYAKSAGAVAWGNVSGKPAQATRWPSWGEVTGKPSLLATTGGTMTGNINWTARGTNFIGNGANDAANGVGGALNNLVISSWNGVSFTTSCGGQTYTNKNAVSINCRNGHVYANTYHGYLNGNADTAGKATNDGSGRNIVNTYATKTDLANEIKKLSDRITALENWKKNQLFDAQGRLCFPNGNKFWID